MKTISINPNPASSAIGGLQADPSGALWWPDADTLILADLHLEKGSSYARHGSLLPPYDTRGTLLRIEAIIDRLRPARILALGDSFHDSGAGDRLDPADVELLKALTARQEWIWLAGNHDPHPPAGLGGRVQNGDFAIGPLVFRHEAEASCDPRGFEISGHYHPKASIQIQGRRLNRRCFVADDRRLVMPAFGAYAGGLDIRHPAFGRLFPGDFTAYLVGRSRVLAVASSWFSEKVREGV